MVHFLKLKSIPQRFVLPLMLVIAFAAGFVVNQIRFAQAGTSEVGYRNQIYEVLEGGTRMEVYSMPSQTDPNSEVIDILLWGDRVMWDLETEQQDELGNRWIKVSMAEGISGWIIANLDQATLLKGSEATYTTPGIEVGKSVTVTQQGDHANFRSEADVIPGRDNIIRFVEAGEVLTVEGGPYQSQYFIWWQYQDASGQRGWIVDIEGWFAVNE
jgi:hypothetical protein